MQELIPKVNSIELQPPGGWGQGKRSRLDEGDEVSPFLSMVRKTAPMEDRDFVSEYVNALSLLYLCGHAESGKPIFEVLDWTTLLKSLIQQECWAWAFARACVISCITISNIYIPPSGLITFLQVQLFPPFLLIRQ